MANTLSTISPPATPTWCSSFLSDPQGWKKPPPRDDAAELIASGARLYVHAPYLMNLASPNNRIRIPSRKNLAQTVEAAAAIGAAGVIVHGGHVGDDEDISVGYERWRKALDTFESSVPVLIENTAGGGNAVVRELENYAPLWEEIGDYNVGACPRHLSCLGRRIAVGNSRADGYRWCRQCRLGPLQRLSRPLRLTPRPPCQSRGR